MMIRCWLTTFFSFLLFLSLSAQKDIQSPSTFLDNTYGKRFTPHHQVVEYFRYIDEISDKVQLVEYGQTYELRPLIAAVISSPANLARLEQIRLNNLKRTGMIEGDAINENISIVHLSYSIHGNEAAGTESALTVLYTLVKGEEDIDQWLSNTIVIIDPCLNPDGFSRYVQWNNSVANTFLNANADTREHNEPWPGGRTNHYYFDLNRDWAWLSQKETRDRIAFYLNWMPHIHADVHEMRASSNYYFAPAAQPYHPYLTKWQSEFQVDIGKNHASYFDEEGWLYFTKEDFDLFYPSFGDTYPMLSGSIGLTYEQAGSHGAGRAVTINTGDTLKLTDRIAHHAMTSLSTVEVASKNAERIVKEFDQYFKNGMSGIASDIRNYVIKKSNNAGRVHDLLKLLDAQKIRYGMATKEHRSIKGFSYHTNSSNTFNVEAGDIIIPIQQPRSVLLNVLFEPEATLADSLTYDITAWSIPMAYGLETYTSSERIDYTPYVPAKNILSINDNNPYGYAVEWGSVSSARLVADLVAKGLIGKYNTIAFAIDGKQFAPGTILFLRADNRHHNAFDVLMRRAALNDVVTVSTLTTGFVDTGRDLGSQSYQLVRNPKVLTVSGQGVFSQSLGQVWHFFEEELGQQIDIIHLADLDNTRLSNHNVIILPEGSYNFSAETLQKLKSWIGEGGRLILIGSAMNSFVSKDGFSIKRKENGVQPQNGKEELAHAPSAYDSYMRSSLSDEINGAVIPTAIDKTNPLTFGLGTGYWTLKNSATAYQWLPSGGNGIYLDDKPTFFGFAGIKARENLARTIVAGSESIGSGKVIYLVDNPLFRSFWNSGKVLFSNALFF